MATNIEDEDAGLRARFAARDGSCAGEDQLKCDLVLRPPALLAAFPLVVSDEWEPVPGRTEYGRGDLVFADGRGHYAVVEVKWMNPPGDGRTARRRRNRKRDVAPVQAWRYASLLLKVRPDAIDVRVMAFTNDWQHPGLIDLGLAQRPEPEAPASVGERWRQRGMTTNDKHSSLSD